jgi:molecular chaperone DnaK
VSYLTQKTINNNISFIKDIIDWSEIVTKIFDTSETNISEDYIETAVENIPEEPFDYDSWDKWTKVIGEKSGLKVEEIDKVILVGGSTKSPLVQTILQQQLGKTPYKNINPDECVALGASIAAGIKSGRIKKTIIRDVLPQPLGTDIDNDVMDILLDKNAPLPARKSKVYTTTEDDQDTISIKIYQGVYPKASSNQLLGEYFFSGIRKAKRGEPSIEITFKVDVNGILKVSARDLDTNKEMSWVVKREMKESESLPENKREQLEFYGQED